MTSNLLSKIGLGNMDIGIFVIVITVLLIASIITSIVLIVKLNKVTARYEKFMRGSKAQSLEDTITSLIENVNALNDESAIHEENIGILFAKHSKSFQKMGLVKYDAYKEMGGKLSYALTLLDEYNDGFLTNSVHSSTGCYSYTKRIKQGTCELDLSPEEQASLDKALQAPPM